MVLCLHAAWPINCVSESTSNNPKTSAVSSVVRILASHLLLD